jgi:hypothetical protein
VSRTRHTDPIPIRAARRLLSPRAGPGAGDPSASRRASRTLKEHGLAGESPTPAPLGRPIRPRIIVHPPRPGHIHPVGKPDILRALATVGPEASYGVRSIELAHGVGGPSGRLAAFGRFHAPGRIVLFEQPAPPWRIRGLLTPSDRDLLARAGAAIAVNPAATETLVDWPDDTLRDFMLFDVLLHEIGHHLLQHHKGKRPARIARTRDHEAFANRFVERCRRIWADSTARP